jgi:hypothetical protein
LPENLLHAEGYEVTEAVKKFSHAARQVEDERKKPEPTRQDSVVWVVPKIAGSPMM